MDGQPAPATTRLPRWIAAWRGCDRLVLLLDFDGTLAPIVERPELARPLPEAIAAAERLRMRDGVDLAVVSGRALGDVRARAGLNGIIFAGNHGLEIEGPGFLEVHAEAASARPLLDDAAAELKSELIGIGGVFVEHKGLTLSVHYRQVAASGHGSVRKIVEAAIGTRHALVVTEGKRVLEVRPRVEWHKGRAVEYLLNRLQPPAGAPVIYLGDDTTDEDAFAAVKGWSGKSGEGMLVAEIPRATAALSMVRNPHEVARLLTALADA